MMTSIFFHSKRFTMLFLTPLVLCTAVKTGFAHSTQIDSPHFDNSYRLPGKHHKPAKAFNRIASFPVYLNTAIELETVAEIVDVSRDGRTLVYTDGVAGKLGFVDIRYPAKPKALGSIDVGGEPTSVAVTGKYALVAVNTSSSFTEPSGQLLVIDIDTQAVVKQFDLGGQPDSVAVSPDRRYAAVVIENERDEDFAATDGAPPQGPSGFLVIVDILGKPSHWALRTVQLAGIPDLFPTDAEPEFVDINKNNVAVVTLQENNYLILVDLASGRILNDFSAGSVNLDQIDTLEEDPALISLTDEQLERLREPDGVAWLTDTLFVTANEGDLDGGSRDFSIFDTAGRVKFTAGNTLDHQTVRTGHYPDGRSKNKGNEPENVDIGRFNGVTYLFVASERANVIFVYQVIRKGHAFKQGLNLKLVQTLPTGVGPEGIKAIPKRNLLVSASEKDARDDGFRSVLTLYRLQRKPPAYPTVVSADRVDGTPIPWAALSGLALDPDEPYKAYTIHDSFFQQSRVYTLNLKRHPAVIEDEIVMQDSQGLLAAIHPQLVNEDNSVNLDPEGISTSASGGFWIASEGAGTVGDSDRPFASYNLLLHVGHDGEIDSVVKLPAASNAQQVRFGFEGVASVGSGENEVLFVSFQREWQNDPEGYARIGRYEKATQTWSFYYYPLDMPESPNGGWVGLSDISALNDHEFAVIERDNQANTDARIKKIYRFSVKDLTPLPEPATGTPAFPALSKTLVKDLLPVLKATGGMVLEKIEGLAISDRNDGWIVNDNDGVDDSNGETQLIKLKNLIH